MTDYAAALEYRPHLIIIRYRFFGQGIEQVIFDHGLVGGDGFFLGAGC